MTSGDIKIKVKTDIIEMSGSEKIVYFNLNNSKCIAKVPIENDVNEFIELKLDLKNLYFFDK